MKLMVLGDRMLGGVSAYSKVVYKTCVLLAKEGYQVAHTPMGYANRMGKQLFENVVIYPSGDNAFSEDVAIDNYVDFGADLLISVKEPWVFTYIYKMAINFVPMAIIDHSPVSTEITERLRNAFKVISISRHAQAELMQNKIENTYIPHGCDTSMYRPLDKSQCKKLWCLDKDDFTVGIVAMNRARKMIPRMLQGYKRFRELNPDIKSHLMLWTNVLPAPSPQAESMGVADVGVSLLPEIMRLGLGEAVRWTDEKTIKRGIPEWAGDDYENGYDMVKLYNSMDVLLLCTGGEGFGLPLIEAQSCGVPVITTNYAAGPEQVGSGYVIPWKDYVILNTPGTRYALADIDGMAEALTKVMNGNAEHFGKRARLFASRYDWDKIVSTHWKPFLNQCEEELHPLFTEDGQKTW